MTTSVESPEQRPSQQQQAILDFVSHKRGWFIALGIFLILVGSASIAMPFASSLAVEMIAGVSLVVGGIGQIVHAFSNKKWSGFFLALAVGAIWFLAGMLLVTRPMEGLAILTAVAGAAFIAEGTLRSILAFRLRPRSGWGAVLFGGAVGMIVGVMLWAQFPISALWALGVLAGVNILFSGVGSLMLALAADRVMPSARAEGMAAAKPA